MNRSATVVTLASAVLAAAAMIAPAAEARSGAPGGHGAHGGGMHACPGHAHGRFGVHGGPALGHAHTKLGRFHGCAAGGGYGPVSYDRDDAVDRELHERVARTSRAKVEFARSHPCPATGATTRACPGYAIACVGPDASQPERCFDPANLAWTPSSAPSATGPSRP